LGVKLGHFTINNFFLYATKMQAYQQKTEKFFFSEEKSLVGSTPGQFLDTLCIKSNQKTGKFNE